MITDDLNQVAGKRWMRAARYRKKRCAQLCLVVDAYDINRVPIFVFFKTNQDLWSFTCPAVTDVVIKNF